MKHHGSTPSRLRTAAFALAAAAACFGAVPAAASGQSLHLAELFAEQGRTGDARAEVMAWFEIRGESASDEELQHFIWLRGRLAEDRAAGLRDLERLVAEHPAGPYTAPALVWLADDAVERGDEGAAMAYRAQVVRNFPESEPAARAREWLRARGLEVDEPAPPVAKDSVPATVPPRAPARARPAPADSVIRTTTSADSVPPEAPPADSVPSTPPADTTPSAPPAATPEPADTVPTPAAVADSTPTPAPPASQPEPEAQAEAPPAQPTAPAVQEIAPGPPVPGAAEAGAFAVQIGAFRNPDGAAGLVDELIEAGFDARLVQVPANTLLRVRVGRFPSADAANAELQRVRDGGYDGAVVDDARSETVVSR